MDVLLIGGKSSIMDAMINKLNKEGHRIYVLTGNRFNTHRYHKAFEQYDFSYENECIKEVFESIDPDVVIYTGAYDTTFNWSTSRKESVAYSAGLVNVLMACASLGHCRFIYLSSEEIFHKSCEHNIMEHEQPANNTFKALAIAQGETTCDNYQRTMGIDTVVLRLDHVYGIPHSGGEITEICGRMCLEALTKGRIQANGNHIFSMLYVTDAVEFIYQIMMAKKHKRNLYHLSSATPINEQELAQIVASAFGNVSIDNHMVGKEYRVVLSNREFEEEFHGKIFHTPKKIIPQIVTYMKKHSKHFTDDPLQSDGFIKRTIKKFYVIFRALVPFAENLVCFIPFFMLNNRAVGSEYFANLDFYLLYVLLFAIVYGQQQATFSAILATAGYMFRQQYNRSSFDVILDYNTYVWIAQLFILGLVVGYMKDRLKQIRGEGEHEIDYLEEQLDDIADINTTNVHIKNVLETQIVNQNDSFGKVFEVTSSLDQYEPEEVLFYATDVLGRLIDSKDVAIYTIANDSYARLFAATSPKARVLGNSIEYKKYVPMYEAVKEEKVYVNKDMDDKYPLMANAIFSEEKMQMILMVWGIPWERMNLGQANMLKIVGYLIQNAVIRANNYMEALEEKRYVSESQILEEEAFSSLARAYMNAKAKGLTECTIVRIDTTEDNYQQAGAIIGGKLRNTDYLGRMSDGNLHVLLSNTNQKDAEFVLKRFAETGYHCEIQEDVLL